MDQNRSTPTSPTQIYISTEDLKESCTYNSSENIWSWIYDSEDTEDDDTEDKESATLPMRKNDEIRLLVTEVLFKDVMSKEDEEEDDDHDLGLNIKQRKTIKEKMDEAAFVVRGQIRDDCLGLLSWWCED